MAKKSRINKKHQFKHTQQIAVGEENRAPVGNPQDNAAIIVAAQKDYGYVGRDIRKLAFLAASLVIIELAIWVLLNKTGLGSSILDLIKI